MKIKTLKFMGETRGKLYEKIEVEISGPHDLDKLKTKKLPKAYVVLDGDLKHIREFKDQVIDQGAKDERKSLSYYLLNKSNIPLLKGNYSDLGQLKRSIRDLLKNAEKAGEKNIYFISVAQKLFNSLWEQTPKGSGPALFKDLRELMEEEETTETDDADEMELARVYLGEAKEIQTIRKFILKAVNVDYPVLVLGDTGTGKECVARAIHTFSLRKKEKLIVANCAAIPTDLFEAELFGYKKGAFTNAFTERIGLWKLADNGTLFLDEIGDLSLFHQGKILRVLEDNKIWPIGEKTPQEVNARVVAATNRNLPDMVKSGQFRDDLFYRLDGLTIRTPPLKDHSEDIPDLAQHLWKKINEGNQKYSPLSKEILKELQSYPWPGNAREMKMILRKIRTLFPKVFPEVRHLRALMNFQGQSLSKQLFLQTDNQGYHDIECLNQLRRVEETIKSCELAVNPISRNFNLDPRRMVFFLDSFQMRIDELEVFCKHPLLFHENETFDSVHQFKGKLIYFHGLLQKDMKEAMRYWQRDIRKGYQKTLDDLSKEMGALLNNAF